MVPPFGHVPHPTHVPGVLSLWTPWSTSGQIFPILSQLEQIRKDIRDFRSSAGLDKVIVLWTANTERFCEVVPGRNDTAENLLRTIQVGTRPGFLGVRAIPEALSDRLSALSLA